MATGDNRPTPPKNHASLWCGRPARKSPPTRKEPSAIVVRASRPQEALEPRVPPTPPAGGTPETHREGSSVRA